MGRRYGGGRVICTGVGLSGFPFAGSTPVIRSIRFNAEAAKPNHSNDSQFCRHLLDHTIFAELLSPCCHEVCKRGFGEWFGLKSFPVVNVSAAVILLLMDVAT